MSGIPEEVRSLADERERARRAKDYVLADALRDRIREAGFDVVDRPSGPEVVRAEPASSTPHPEPYARSDDVPDQLSQPATCDASVQWVVQGWAEDVVRGVSSFRRHQGNHAVQYVVVDLAGTDPGIWEEDVEVVAMAPDVGWASARNAGLRRSAGRVVLIVNGSVEAQGDVLSPLIEALEDETVGLTGPFGIVTDDLREFRDSKGPEVDAVEGYVMAMRRTVVESGARFDEKFRFYRTADIELSFQVKDRGLRVTVTPVPIRRHEHRMWANTREEDRARLSKRNFYRFLDKWRGRTDLLGSGEGAGPHGGGGC